MDDPNALIPYPVVDKESELPDDAPIGAIAPVGKSSMYLKTEKGWWPTYLQAESVDDLPMSVPDGVAAHVYDEMFQGYVQLIKTPQGWAQDLYDGMSREQRIETKLDRVLQLLEERTPHTK